MKRFSEQFNKQASQIRLSASERNDLRERLVAYMEYHPLSAQAKQVSETAVVAPKLYRTVRIDIPLISRFVGAFAVLTLIVVPVFAENTVPGDILYPVKVKFNEEVRSAITFSPYEKVEWETARLERRISEAQLLANAGRLTPEVEAQVAEAVKNHSNAAKKEIDLIGTTDVAEATIARIALNSALEVQTEVLEKQLAKGTDQASSTPNGQSVSAIAAAIGEVKSSGTTNFDISTLPPDKLLAYLESETTRAYEYLDSVKPVASATERNDIRRRLNDVNKKIKSAVDSDRQVTNPDLLITAITDIRKLISFMTNIDVRENVSVEDLVPIVLTPEEHEAILTEKSAKLKELNELVISRLDNVPEENREKMDLSLLRVTELTTEAAVAASGEDYLLAEVSLDEALLILSDLDQQTAPYQTEEPETEEQATTTDEAVEDTGETGQATTTNSQ